MRIGILIGVTIAVVGCQSKIVATSDRSNPALAQTDEGGAGGDLPPTSGGGKDPLSTSISVTATHWPVVIRPGDVLAFDVNLPSDAGAVAQRSVQLAPGSGAFGSPVLPSVAGMRWSVPLPSNWTQGELIVRAAVTLADGRTGSVDSPSIHVVRQVSRPWGVADLGFDYDDSSDRSAAAFRTPSGLASDGTWVYFTEAGRISRFHVTTGERQVITGQVVVGVSLSVDGGSGDALMANDATSLCLLGNQLYFLEPTNHVLRVVDVTPNAATFGAVTTVAGAKGASGHVDAAGTAARFNEPRAVVTDGSMLYIADSRNHVVRMIDPSNGHDVTTIVGAPGVSGASVALADGVDVRMDNPQSLAVIGTSLFVSEFTNAVITRVDLADPDFATTRFFGIDAAIGLSDGDNTTGKLFFEALATDGTDLYLIGYFGVRRLDVATATSTPLAGAPGQHGTADGAGTAARFARLNAGVVVGGALYVSDRFNAAIRRIDIGTGAVTTAIGNLVTTPRRTVSGPMRDLASFDYGRGIASDDGIVFYVTQSSAHVVRRIDTSNNVVTTLAGSPFSPGYANGVGNGALFNLPAGIVKLGNALYVADTNNHAIRKIDLTTLAVTTFAGQLPSAGAGVYGKVNGTGTVASFRNPVGLALDDVSQKIYVADRANHRIRVVDVGTAVVSTFAGADAGSDDGTGTAATFRAPQGVALSPDRATLYVADTGNHTVRSIVVASAAVTTLAGQAQTTGDAVGAPGSARFFNPYGLAARGDDLFVADGSNAKIKRLKLSAPSEVFEFAGGGKRLWVASGGIGPSVEFGQPFALRMDGDWMTVVDTSSPIIRRFNVVTRESSVVAGQVWSHSLLLRGASDGKAVREIPSAYGGAVHAAGKIYVYDASSAVMRRLALDGTEEAVVAGQSGRHGSVDGVAGAARLGFGRGLVAHGGYLYFAESENHVVRRMRLSDGAVSTVAGSAGNAGAVDGNGAAARFNGPRGLSVDGDALVVADQLNGTVRRISIAPTSFGATTTLAGTAGVTGAADGVGGAAQFNGPTCAFASGNYVYVCDGKNFTLRRLDKVTGQVLTWVGSAGAFGLKAGIAGAARPGSLLDVTQAGEHLYGFADEGVVWRIDPKTREATLFAGEQGSRLDVLAAPRPVSGPIPLLTSLTFDSEAGFIAGGPFGLYRFD